MRETIFSKILYFFAIINTMIHNNENIVDEVVELSSRLNKNDHDKLIKFIELYKQQEEVYEKSKKQNEIALKKLDRCNNLVHKNDKILEQHSRQAAMGEIIDVVAHQWKQPLNSISMIIDMLKTDFHNGCVDVEYIDDLEQIIHMQINHMTTTLTEFRNFLRPNTKDEKFNLSSIMKNVQLLMKDELLSQNIQLNINIDNNIELNGNKNEFKHIFINLINNSIDAFNENHIVNSTINITSYLEDDFVYIKISDNAGGISDKIIHKIFKPNFTTKTEGKGTGIGLYIIKQLVKKSHGTIKVSNLNEGTLFVIKLKVLIK